MATVGLFSTQYLHSRLNPSSGSGGFEVDFVSLKAAGRGVQNYSVNGSAHARAVRFKNLPLKCCSLNFAVIHMSASHPKISKVRLSRQKTLRSREARTKNNIAI